MKEYLLLFRGGNTYGIEQPPGQIQAHMQRWMEWMGNLGKEGKFVGAQPLDHTGKTVSGTQKVISDGPFMEGKEMVGGYLIVNAKDIDEAVEISKGCPIFNEDGKLEVRPLQKM